LNYLYKALYHIISYQTFYTWPKLFDLTNQMTPFDSLYLQAFSIKLELKDVFVNILFYGRTSILCPGQECNSMYNFYIFWFSFLFQIDYIRFSYL